MMVKGHPHELGKFRFQTKSVFHVLGGITCMWIQMNYKYISFSFLIGHLSYKQACIFDYMLFLQQNMYGKIQKV